MISVAIMDICPVRHAIAAASKLQARQTAAARATSGQNRPLATLRM
jgi:hypothetical protein